MRSTTTPPDRVKIAWRRPSFLEALSSGVHVFAAVCIAHVAWDAVTTVAVNYERAFFQGASFGAGYLVAGLLFKSKMVVLRVSA